MALTPCLEWKLVEKKPVDVESTGFFFIINPLAFLIVLWYVSICG